MKHTQIIELFRNIKKRLVSFIAIVLFVTLGVGVFLGIGWSGKALTANADKVYAEQNMYDLQLLYPFGFGPDALDALKQVPGADAVEGGYLDYAFFELGGARYYARLGQLTGSENAPYYIEGTLPEKPDEIAVEASWARKTGLKTGDTVTFTADDDGTSRYLKNIVERDTEGLLSPHESESGMKHLVCRSFTVTALMESPEFIINSAVSYGSSAETSISVDCLMFLPECAFDADSYTGFPAVYIRSEALRQHQSGSDGYLEAAEGLRTQIMETAAAAAEDKTGLIEGNAETMLDEFGARLFDAECEIADGEKRISEGHQALEEAKEQIKDGEKQLEEGAEQLDKGRRELWAAEAKLKKGKQALAPMQEKLDKAQKMLDAAQTAYDKAKQEYSNASAGVSRIGALASKADDEIEDALDALRADGTLSKLNTYVNTVADRYPELATRYSNFFSNAMNDYYYTAVDALRSDAAAVAALFAPALQDAKKALEDAGTELDARKAELEQGKKDIKPYIKQIEDGEKQISYNAYLLNQKEKELEDGRAALEDAKLQAADKELELKDAEIKLAQGKEEFKENSERLEKARIDYAELCRAYTCGAMLRNQNAGFGAVLAIAEILTNLRFTLAGLFLIVGMFVCYTALSRLVNDQVIQIGTKKALGLTQKEITLSFLAFSGIAALIGIVLGMLLGTVPVEIFMTKAIARSFNFRDIKPYFSIADAAHVCLLEFAVIMIATVLSCRRILKKRAIVLLKGEEDRGGKQRFYEKTKLWDRLHLLTRTIISNCVNDKRRVLGTLVGIAGCTALIVSIYTMTDNLESGLEKQFGSLQSFDAIVYTDRLESSNGNVKAVLDADGTASTLAYVQAGAGSFPDGTSGAVFMYVLTEDNAGDFKSIVPSGQDAPVPLTDGVWVSRQYENTYHAKPGDTYTFVNSIGERKQMEIAGFFDCFLTNQEIVMNAETYEKVFESNVYPNAFLIDSGGRSKAELESVLQGTQGFNAVYDFRSASVLAFESMASISSALKVLYVVLSVLMAILVLLNILIMFVDEKKKELIVLMINGYSRKDARRYIYSDTIVLTVIGIIIGIVLGTLMGMLSATSFESSRTYIAKAPVLYACLAGAGGTAVLTFIMSCIALGRINNFKLTDLKE